MSQSNLEQKSPKKRVEFTLDEEPSSTVHIAGNFNDWKPDEMKYHEKKGYFIKTKKLPPGQYEYKFIVNGVWIVDAKNEDFIYNDRGSMNSLLIVE